MGQIKFKLGQLVATPGAIEALKQAGVSPLQYLQKHQSGDWGDMCDEDKELNDEAVSHEGCSDRQGRVMSAYHLPNNTKIWIITESDRSITTILLPSEY